VPGQEKNAPLENGISAYIGLAAVTVFVCWACPFSELAGGMGYVTRRPRADESFSQNMII
jgi:hypothetical protein